MENEKQAPVFTDGLMFRLPSSKAPDFILLQMSVKPHNFFKWCQDNMIEGNNGWVNVAIKKARNGTVYADLDTFVPKPKETPESEAYNNTKYQVDTKTSASEDFPNGIELRDHPFSTDAEKEAWDAMDKIPFE